MTTPARTTLTTLLALAPDLVERDRIRRQALRMAAVRHEGLSPLREVAFAGEGLALTWEVPVESESLITGEGALAALVPVAAGLALLHDAGLAHGGISQGSLHVHDGRGVLCGWRPGGTPEADVHDLVALLDACLPPSSVSADVAHLLIAGADPDPATRPTMAKVAAVLEHACAVHAPLISPPAHRRARIGEAPPPRPADPIAADVAPRRSGTTTVRGRHAARRAPACPHSQPRSLAQWRRWPRKGRRLLISRVLSGAGLILPRCIPPGARWTGRGAKSARGFGRL